MEKKQQLALEKMKLEMEEAQQKETIRLEKEKERFLRELKERLEMEKKKVRFMYLIRLECLLGVALALWKA